MSSSRWCALVLLGSLHTWAMSPLEKNDPQIDEGQSAFDKQDFESALRHFDAAASTHPQDARAQFNRGTALHKLHRNDEAREAFKRADELDRDGSLKNKIHYNLGNVNAEDQKRDEAISEYRKALRADPSDPLSRHNLEVMLKNVPPKQSSGPDGGQQGDAGKPDAGNDSGIADAGGADGGRDAGSNDGGPQDGGEQDGGRPDGGSDGGQSDAGRDGGLDGGQNGGDGGAGDGGTGDGGRGDDRQSGDAGASQGERGDGGSDGGAEEQDGGVAEAGEMQNGDGGTSMSKKEAEKLLDAFKSNEKNMQLWKFKKQTQKNNTHGKDW